MAALHAASNARPRALSHFDVVLLACITLGIHAATLAVTLRDPGRSIEEDSRGYLTLAANLESTGRFGRFVRTGPTSPDVWQNEILRTPAYPAVIAALNRATGHGRAATVVVQHLLISGLGLFAAIACAGLWGRKAGLVAGYLLAADVQGLALSSLVLTETLYGVTLFACAWMTVKAIERPAPASSAAAGVLAGLTALLRPTSIALPIALGVWLVVVNWRAVRARLIAAACILAMAGSAIVGAWVVRNGRVAGQYTLSSVARYNLLACHAAGALVRARHMEDQAAIDELCDEAGVTEWQLRYFPLDAAAEARVRSVSIQAMRNNAAGFAAQYVRKTVNMLAAPEKHIMTALGLPWSGSEAAPSATGPVAALLSAALLAAQLAFVAVLYFMVWTSAKQAWSDRGAPTLVLTCLFCAAYVLGLSSGAPGDTRMRWPAIPLLAVVAAWRFSRVRTDSPASTRA